MTTSFEREQVIRLIEKQLKEYGLYGTLGTLEAESGVPLDTPQLSTLRDSVDCSNTETIIKTLQSLIHKDSPQFKRACFYVYSTVYDQLLFEKKTGEAMSLLRDKITPVCENEEQIKALVGRLIISRPPSPGFLSAEDLAEFVAGTHVVPFGRMGQLFRQAVLYQTNGCTAHFNSPNNLLSDISCQHSQRRLSFKTTTVGKHAIYEIWSVEFSHDGHLLAYGCTDCSVRIHRVGEGEEVGHVAIRNILDGLPDKPSVVAFSPDDQYLMIGFEEKGVGWLWSVDEEEYKWKIESSGSGVSAISWIDDNRFIAAYQMKPIIDIYNVRAVKVERRFVGVCVAAMALSADKRIIYAAERHTNSLVTVDLSKNSVIKCQSVGKVGEVITGLACKDSQLLVSTDRNRVILVDLMSGRIVEMTGHHSYKHQLIPLFLNNISDSVACGSEDGRIYIWDVGSGILKHIIGSDRCYSAKPVTCIASHPREPLIASGDDAGRVRVHIMCHSTV
jgi:WD40 repeat protein